MSAAFQSSPPPTFKPQTLGAFLSEGEQGWPETFTATLEDATIRVSRSQVRLECQGCGKDVDRADVQYVRIALDMTVERPGEEPRAVHVEDLYPSHAIDVLETPLDADAAARVQRAIIDTLITLDAARPVHNLLDNCIAPMRLYEPLLNALVSPAQDDTMSHWLDEHIEQMLCDERGEVVALEHDALHVRVQARDLAMHSGLRSFGEVKLVGNITIEDRATGECRGTWKCRATLLPPNTAWRHVPAPSSMEAAHIEAMVRAWRSELAGNIERVLDDGRTPTRLPEVLPEVSLEDRLK